jgi:hypothetical protein
MAVKKTFEFFFRPLLKKFFQDMGRDPNNLEMILLRQKAGQLFKDSNKVINFPQKRSFKEEIEAMKKSGDIVDEKDMVVSEKITDREMFKNSNLNKPTEEITEDTGEGFIDFVRRTDPKGADKLQKVEDEIKAAIEAGNKRAVENLKKKNKKKKEDDPEFYTGGMVDVEPNLSDIGHGSDALMARTRLVSPNSQATTSTGLNYLLAEDNDNIRVPFNNGLMVDPIASEDAAFKAAMNAFKYYVQSGGTKNFRDYMRMQSQVGKQGGGLENFRADGGRINFKVGGDAGRRAFLKLLASLTGGAAAVKSGIIGLGEGTTKKAITETVKKSAGSGTPPPYFFKLVEKIKTLGDDTLASKDKATAYKYKDYVLEEDFAGNIEIMKKQSLTDNPYPEDVYMSLKVDDVPIKGKKGSAKVEQYEEYTARPDGDGKMKDVDDGVPDEVVQEGTMFEDTMTEFGKTKKADGGRINFSAGSLARLGITGSSRKFLEKVFGKEKFARMIENDPELHRGLLEVVEMFRKKDKEGLKMYMQKFLPHMDDATVEDFIVGSGGTEGIEGQLIRLGSGRDYQGKIQMMKEADNMRKLDALDIDKMKPNANGGRITFDSGGSPLQRLRQEIVESMKPYAPGVPEEKLQIIVKDINFDMSPEEVQNTVRQGFINLFGMAKGGLATMLGE